MMSLDPIPFFSPSYIMGKRSKCTSYAPHASSVLKLLVITSQPLLDVESDTPAQPLDINAERSAIARGMQSSGLNVSISYLCEATPTAVANALKADWDIHNFLTILSDSFGFPSLEQPKESDKIENIRFFCLSWYILFTSQRMVKSIRCG